MDAQNVLNLAELFGMFDVLDGIALVLAVSVLVNYVKWTIRKKKGNRQRNREFVLQAHVQDVARHF